MTLKEAVDPGNAVGGGMEPSHSDGLGDFSVTPVGRGCFVILGKESLKTRVTL